MSVKKCRICGNPKLVKIGSLGKISLSNFTVKPSLGVRSPLELVYCTTCTLLQLSHNSPRNDLYHDHYWYESAINPTIVKDLESVVSDALKHIKFKKGDSWIDIGANDGTLLSFVPRRFNKIGVDPATNLRKKLSKHADRVITNYFDKARIQVKARVITAIAVVYDLPNPNRFFSRLKQSLAPDGVAVIQLMTLSPMIQNNDIGNICHEHIEYYSYKSLTSLVEASSLEIFKVYTNNMNGGSYRLFLRHKNLGSIKFREQEYSIRDLKNFFAKVERNKKKFLAFLKDAKLKKKKVVAYGASTKGNTILQFYGLSRKNISAVVDVNPDKIGRFLVASKIPIVNTVPECEYLWVLPYAFLNMFVKKEKSFRKRGGKFVVSTPEFKII